MASRRKKAYVSEINVTPFVDVMLVVLIIFMVSAPMMEQGIEVDLPQTTQVETLPTEEEYLVLTINKEGILYLDEYEVTIEELQGHVENLVKQKGRSLFLQADNSVPYGLVVDVMGRIKAGGVENLGIVAIPAELDKK